MCYALDGHSAPRPLARGRHPFSISGCPTTGVDAEPTGAYSGQQNQAAGHRHILQEHDHLDLIREVAVEDGAGDQAEACQQCRHHPGLVADHDERCRTDFEKQGPRRVVDDLADRLNAGLAGTGDRSMLPVRKYTSARFTPNARTLIRTSSAVAATAGTSRSSRIWKLGDQDFEPKAVITTNDYLHLRGCATAGQVVTELPPFCRISCVGDHPVSSDEDHLIS